MSAHVPFQDAKGLITNVSRWSATVSMQKNAFGSPNSQTALGVK